MIAVCQRIPLQIDVLNLHVSRKIFHFDFGIGSVKIDVELFGVGMDKRRTIAVPPPRIHQNLFHNFLSAYFWNLIHSI